MTKKQVVKLLQDNNKELRGTKELVPQGGSIYLAIARQIGINDGIIYSLVDDEPIE